MGRANPLKPRRYEDCHPPLARAELPINTVALARYLIGRILVRELAEGVTSGRIVETEAYVVGDAAGPAHRGITPRTRSLCLERGHAYVYLAYGSSYMLNVSSEMPGIGAGVLIRAIEPLEGIPIMQRNRGTGRLFDLARGPGRLMRRKSARIAGEKLRYPLAMEGCSSTAVKALSDRIPDTGLALIHSLVKMTTGLPQDRRIGGGRERSAGAAHPHPAWVVDRDRPRQGCAS